MNFPCPVGAYAHSWALVQAIAEGGLDCTTNVDIDYYQYIIPLQDIIESGFKGGPQAFIARERFREIVETFPYELDYGSIESMLKEEGYIDLEELLGEEVYWALYHDGMIRWTSEIDCVDDIVDQLLESCDCSTIIYIDSPTGYIYVLKSPYRDLGRVYKGTGIHPFEETVVFNEDHPQYCIVEGLSLDPETLSDAIDYSIRFGEEL